MSEALAAVVKQLVGSRAQRDVAIEAGVSQGTIHNLMRGIVPTRRLLVRIADGLALDAKTRAELFYAAGYVEGRPEEVSSVA